MEKSTEFFLITTEGMELMIPLTHLRRESSSTLDTCRKMILLDVSILIEIMVTLLMNTIVWVETNTSQRRRQESLSMMVFHLQCSSKLRQSIWNTDTWIPKSGFIYSVPQRPSTKYTGQHYL